MWQVTLSHKDKDVLPTPTLILAKVHRGPFCWYQSYALITTHVGGDLEGSMHHRVGMINLGRFQPSRSVHHFPEFCFGKSSDDPWLWLDSLHGSCRLSLTHRVWWPIVPNPPSLACLCVPPLSDLPPCPSLWQPFALKHLLSSAWEFVELKVISSNQALEPWNQDLCLCLNGSFEITLNSTVCWAFM